MKSSDENDRPERSSLSRGRRRWTRVGLALGMTVLALASATSVALADDDHRGRGRDGGRERDDDDRGERGRQAQIVVAPNPPVQPVYQPRAAAPQCAPLDPSVATVDSVFAQFVAGGGLSLNQAALIGNALYLSANEVQELSFDQMLSMTQCAGVSLDTLAMILSGA